MSSLNPFTHTSQILSFLNHLENRYSLKLKDTGISRIDISIDFYSSNTHSSISDSFSAMLGQESEEEVQRLMDLFVAAVEEVFGGTSEDNTQKK
jgi:hypothetical protein